MKRRFGTKQVVPLVIAGICVVFLCVGLQRFGFWNAKRAIPTPAFVPIIICALLAAICLLTVLTSLKEDGTAKYHKEEFLIIGAAVGMIAATYLIGMLPTLALFVVLWLKLVEKTPWPTVLIILAIVAAIVYGVFVLWLGVRFPEGLILEALNG